MKNINWANVEAVESFKKLEAGGYVCGITAVEDHEDREYLKLEFDIIEGDLKGYYRDLYDRKGFWGGNFIRSYKESARGFFKKFLNAVEASNPNYKFDNNEKKLRGKTIGLVLGYEEYISNNGEVKKRMYVADILSLDDIRAENFTVPKLKKLALPNNITSNSDFEEITNDDDDLPWN